LHRLPGFAAIGIPSRFWGYLALPLALACAAALDAVQEETTPARPRRLLWAGVFLTILGFQAASIVPPFVTEKGRIVVETKPVPQVVRSIRNVHGPVLSQAAELSPDTGLLEAYDAHEYVQGIIREGSDLVVAAATPTGEAVPVEASWDGWSRIRVAFPSGAPNGTGILFNQNSHPRWGFTGGLATRDRQGNLRAVLARDAAPGTRFDLSFHDPASALGQRVSFWSAIAAAAAALALAGFAFARRL